MAKVAHTPAGIGINFKGQVATIANLPANAAKGRSYFTAKATLPSQPVDSRLYPIHLHVCYRAKACRSRIYRHFC